MATFGDGEEASVEESLAAFARLRDFTALDKYRCLTVAQCASVVAFSTCNDEPFAVVDAHFRMACLDIAKGLLIARHPNSFLPWSQYLRMMDAGMYGKDGAATPMPDGGWLVDLDEVVRWYATQGISVDVSSVKIKIEGVQENLAEPAPRPNISQRSDLLSPLIQEARNASSDPNDASSVWPILAEMAKEKRAPFLEVTDSGLKWVDSQDQAKFLTLKNLRDRLRRQ